LASKLTSTTQLLFIRHLGKSNTIFRLARMASNDSQTAMGSVETPPGSGIDKVESPSSTSCRASSNAGIAAIRDEGGFRIKRQQIDSQRPVGIEKEVSIDDEVAQGAKYVIDGPLRRVPPYYFTYLTYCKLRWRDRLLYDIFVSEFRDRDKDYYVRQLLDITR
jgi:tRNA pseudouridine synthase 8/2,5-diamino-6-(5-phospho-D-ribitylamino)-pyrimidin-4(3H)-one deaminase